MENGGETLRILLINPNVSADMTASMAATARHHLPQGASLASETGRFGAKVIASRAAFAIAEHAALEAFAVHADATDGVLVSCFGDPGLAALREVAGVPVTGLLEASVKRAGRIGTPFGIVTAGAAWEAMLAERIAPMAEAPLFRGTAVIAGTGLDIRRDPDSALGAIGEAANQLVAMGARTIILGGGAMAGLADRLALRADVIDCVRAGVQELSAMVERGEFSTPSQSIETSGLSPALESVLRFVGDDSLETHIET